MVDTEGMTPEEIRQAGIEALVRELEPVGMMRFTQWSEKGSGDYTAERHQWLGDPDVDTLVADIEKRRAGKR